MYKKLITISLGIVVMFIAFGNITLAAEKTLVPKILKDVTKDAKNVVNKNQLVNLDDKAKGALQVIDDKAVSDTITPTVAITSSVKSPVVSITSTPEITQTIIPTTVLPSVTTVPVLAQQTVTPALSPQPQVEVSPIVLNSINMDNISVAGAVTTPAVVNPTSKPLYLDSASEKVANENAAKKGINVPSSQKTNDYSILLLPVVILIFGAIVNGVYLLGHFIQNKKIRYLNTI